MTDGQELEIIETAVTPVVATELTLDQLAARQDKIQQAMRERMRSGVHFGRTPGAKKPTLLKPGAETLCSLFMFDPEYEGETHMDENGHLHVLSKCTLFHIPTGNRIASGRGYCSTAERRYAFYKDGNEVPLAKRPEQFNTIVKMADKRALVAATLNATAASDVFTQDVEDMPALPAHADASEPSASAEETRRALFARCTELDKNPETMRMDGTKWADWIKQQAQEQYGVTTRKALNKAQLQGLLRDLEQAAEAEKAANPFS